MDVVFAMATVAVGWQLQVDRIFRSVARFARDLRVSAR